MMVDGQYQSANANANVDGQYQCCINAVSMMVSINAFIMIIIYHDDSAQCVHCSVDCSEYKIELYMIQSNKLLLGINRVWDSEACLEPNSIDTEQ